MEGTSVLAKNKQKTPAENATVGGEQSVLGGAAKEHKPVTFYKKAWFWLIIAVIVLGVAGLVVFLIINANITAEAIKKFDDNYTATVEASEKFNTSFSSIYSDSGLAGYYSTYKPTGRPKDLRNKCLEKFGASEGVIKSIDEMDDYLGLKGEEAVDKYGSGKVRELSENFEKATNILNDAKKSISDCEGILEDALKSDVEITFGEFKVTEGRWWNDTELKVKVKNTSDTSYRFSFTVEAQDEDGKKIDDDYVYTKTLSAGEEAEVTAFDYVSSANEEKLKTAKFVVKKLNESE